MIHFLTHEDEYPDVLEVWQAALILGLTARTVLKYVKTGTVFAYRIGHSYKIPKKELKRYIQSRAVLNLEKGKSYEN